MSQAPPVDVTRSAPETEISLGRELRRAREVRGITIEQIARETKINERYLHALEADRLDLLPGQLYARNFVRAVARTIGADEEELLDYFNYQMRLQEDSSGSLGEGRSPRGPRRGVALAVVAVAAVLVIALLTFMLRRGEGGPAPAPGRRPAVQAPAQPVTLAPAPTEVPAPPQAAPNPTTAARPIPPVLANQQPPAAGPATTVASPAAAPGTTSAARPAETTPATPPTDAGPVPVMRLAFTDPSWVEIQREGDAEPVVGMKQKGETMTYPLDRPVTLTILNSAGAALSVDGQPFRPLGGPQEKRTITVDRKNYTQYLKK